MANKEISIGVKLITDLQNFKTGFQQAQDTSKKFGENVEKNVSVPLTKLEAQLRTLKTAQRRSLTPEQFTLIGNEIKKIQGDIDVFKGKTSQSTGIIDQLIGSAKGLLPAFGFAAIAAGAGIATKKIVESTDATADAWEFAVAGMENATSYFWKTLASGNWSNFMSNMKEAIAAGSKYAETLDMLKDKNRALSMVESDYLKEKRDLETKLRNKTISDANERIKAGQRIQQIEKDLAKHRFDIASEKLEAELDIASQRTKLSKEQLIQVTKDITSEQKIKAQAYNEERAKYKRGGLTEKELDASLVVGKDVDKNVKLYAQILRQYGNLTEETMDKIAAAYVKKNEAEVSDFKTTKKIINTTNSLIAGEEENGQKIIDKADSLDAKIKSLKDQQDSLNSTDIESIQIIGAKITALELLKKAYDNIASDPKTFRTDKFSTMTTGPVTGKLQVSTSEKSKFDSPELAAKKRELGIKVNTQGLEGIGKYLDENTKKVDNFSDSLDDLNDKRFDNIDSLSDSFSKFGDAIGSTTGSFLQMVETILSMIPLLITQISALTVAQVGSSQSITAAKSSEAIASGTAASQSVPFPLNLFALAATIAAIVAALATGVKGYATGGIVPGSSFSGDKILARVNSGEEILPASDPRHRNNRGLNNTGTGTGTGTGADVTIVNEAVVKGEDIYVLMKKIERRINRRT